MLATTKYILAIRTHRSVISSACCCHDYSTQVLYRRDKLNRTLELKTSGHLNHTQIKMDSCQAPDFSAVMVALEHIKELDKQLKEEEVPFSPEASLHLTEITAAVTELVADRRAAHEHLEVETIENSKLRLQINNTRERMSQEIMADVAAAQASNSDKVDQLRKEVITISEAQEASMKRQETLLSQNKELYRKRERVKAEHGEVVAALNEQITMKYGLQMQLDQTRKQIEEVKSFIAVFEQDKITLQQNMALEKEAVTVKQDNLSREEDRIDGEVKRQKQALKRSRRELDRVISKKQENHDHLDELMIHISKLESSLRILTGSRCRCEEQLEGETLKHQELRQQRETLKKEICTLGEGISVAIQHLKEEIASVESKIEEGQASKVFCQESLAQIIDRFERQHNEENEVRSEYFRVSQHLRRSKLQLEECIGSIVKHSSEMKKMNKQITELLEADMINKRVFERNQVEMCSNVHSEKRNISHFEDEKRRLLRLLEEAKKKQEDHVVRMTSDINNARKRYQDLQHEEVILQQQQPKCTDPDWLTNHITQCEVEYREKETKLHQEIEGFTAEMERIKRKTEEKKREVGEKEKRLKELEATWSEEKSRYQRLEVLNSKLREKRSDLELSIQELKENTSTLIEPKEKMKVELEEMRDRHMELLEKQASELRAAEMSIYDSRVKLEQVGLENSRLHLCIRQMTDDISRAKKDKDRYRQESHRLRRDTQALFESLQEAWRDDMLVIQGHQSSDGVLLELMNSSVDYMKSRNQQLGDVSSLLQQLMLDFNKRLGF